MAGGTSVIYASLQSEFADQIDIKLTFGQTCKEASVDSGSWTARSQLQHCRWHGA